MKTLLLIGSMFLLLAGCASAPMPELPPLPLDVQDQLQQLPEAKALLSATEGRIRTLHSQMEGYKEAAARHHERAEFWQKQAGNRPVRTIRGPSHTVYVPEVKVDGRLNDAEEKALTAQVRDLQGKLRHEGSARAAAQNRVATLRDELVTLEQKITAGQAWYRNVGFTDAVALLLGIAVTVVGVRFKQP